MYLLQNELTFDFTCPSLETGGCRERADGKLALSPLTLPSSVEVNERVGADFRIIALRWFLSERGRNEERGSPTAEELPSSLSLSLSPSHPPIHRPRCARPSAFPSSPFPPACSAACCWTTSSPNLFCFLSLLFHSCLPPPPPLRRRRWLLAAP